MLPLALALLSAAFPAAAPSLGIGDIQQRDRGSRCWPGRSSAARSPRAWTGRGSLLAERPDRAGHDPSDPGQDPGGRRSRARLDPIGLLLAAGGALGIVWALIRANSLGWTSPEIAVTLAAGIVLSAAFVGWELRVADPMVPLRLFRSRPIAAGNAATFSVFALLMAMVFFMAQFLETGLGYGPLGAGLRLLPGWATLTVIAPFLPERSSTGWGSAR